jgi:hypothetical protein
VLAPTSQKFTEHLLGAAFVVDVGRIEKIDPIRQATTDHAAGCLKIGLG